MLLSAFTFVNRLRLPWNRYQQANLVMTYIPNLGGGINHGSVLYIFGRYTLDTKYDR